MTLFAGGGEEPVHYHLERCSQGSVLDMEGSEQVASWAYLAGAQQHTPDLHCGQEKLRQDK